MSSSSSSVPLPLLVMGSCCVCYDEKLTFCCKKCGVKTCDECYGSFVDNQIGLKSTCVKKDCDYLDAEVVEKFKGRIKKMGETNQNRVEKLQDEIGVESDPVVAVDKLLRLLQLIVLSPCCGKAYTLQKGFCMSVTCICGLNFCNFCRKVFSSSGECQEHVAYCEDNPNENMGTREVVADGENFVVRRRQFDFKSPYLRVSPDLFIMEQRIKYYNDMILHLKEKFVPEVLKPILDTNEILFSEAILYGMKEKRKRQLTMSYDGSMRLTEVIDEQEDEQHDVEVQDVQIPEELLRIRDLIPPEGVSVGRLFGALLIMSQEHVHHHHVHHQQRRPREDEEGSGGEGSVKRRRRS